MLNIYSHIHIQKLNSIVIQGYCLSYVQCFTRLDLLTHTGMNTGMSVPNFTRQKKLFSNLRCVLDRKNKRAKEALDTRQ